MTDVEIRPITPDDDFDAQLDLGQRAFGVYSAQQADSWLHVARRRAGEGLFLGAFAGGAPAGAAMLHDMRQYWLGSEVRCAGVASVKVAPEHRGAGIGHGRTEDRCPAEVDDFGENRPLSESISDLVLEHDGFAPDDPVQQSARRIMGAGWRSNIMPALHAVLSGPR